MKMSRAGSPLLTFWLLAIGVGCASDAGSDADVVFRNGTVVTADAQNTTAGLLVIRGDRVVSVGDAGAQETLARDTRTVDLQGAVVTPAFVDHHVHLLDVGFALLNAQEGQRLFLDLSDVTSLEELAGRIRSRANSLVTGEWILGSGWNQASWGTGMLPTHDVLTDAAPENPVFLVRTDAHAGWVNQAAFRAAGIQASTPDPAGGAIVRTADREPTGVLLERANELIAPLIPQPSDEQVEEAFRLAAEAMASRGVYEVYDAGFLAYPGIVALNIDFGHYVALLERIDAARPLPITVNLMVPAPSAFADSLTANIARYQSSSPRVRITHLKLFADGALGSRGAALSHPYADDRSTSGIYRMTHDELLREARRALDAGLGVATHAIGDGAVHRTLDVYEQLLSERPNLTAQRLRIEHFSYAQDEDFDRAVRLGVVLSIQSNFNSPVGENPTFGAVRVGGANNERVYAWDRLETMGAPLAEGSDYFSMPGDALAGIHAAWTRQNAVGVRGGGPVGRLVAFRMHTALYPPDGRQPTGGWIAPGALANLVILSANPLAADMEQVSGIRVLATLRNGRVIYDAGVLPSLRDIAVH